ncbi:MAG: RIP metalloprotease RseP [Anaerolineae bacterium]|nr:RIP metalloprotease RseP [Anaerolineae bacterium]
MIEFLLSNDFISALLAFALVLIPAVVIHEFGHYFAAKLIGVSVLEFGVGFPPRALRLFTWQGTEFSLNWLMIGGFVRPLGEDFIGPTEDSEEKEKHDNRPFVNEREELLKRGVPAEKIKSLNEAKPVPRILFMVAGAGANFVSAIIIFIVVALIGLPQEVGARLQIVSLGSVFAGTEVQPGDAIEQVDGAYFANTAEFFALWEARQGQETVLRMRRPATSQPYEVTIKPQGMPSAFVFVSGVAQDSPGAEAGLKPGDLIREVDSKPLPLLNPVTALQNITAERAGQALSLTIVRGNEQLQVSLTPRLNPPPGQGRIGIAIASHYRLGEGLSLTDAQAQQELVPQPLGAAVSYGFRRTIDVLATIISIPGRIIEGTISPEEARPVSIVGISQVGGQFLQQSLTDGTPILMLNFFALVSIFLGFTNLLPLPPLDGGRVVFVLVEMLRGKPVPLQIEYAVYKIGIIFLLSLGLLVIFYDIINPLTLPR